MFRAMCKNESHQELLMIAYNLKVLDIKQGTYYTE